MPKLTTVESFEDLNNWLVSNGIPIKGSEIKESKEDSPERLTLKTRVADKLERLILDRKHDDTPYTIYLQLEKNFNVMANDYREAINKSLPLESKEWSTASRQIFKQASDQIKSIKLALTHEDKNSGLDILLKINTEYEKQLPKLIETVITEAKNIVLDEKEANSPRNQAIAALNKKIVEINQSNLSFHEKFFQMSFILDTFLRIEKLANQIRLEDPKNVSKSSDSINANYIEFSKSNFSSRELNKILTNLETTHSNLTDSASEEKSMFAIMQQKSSSLTGAENESKDTNAIHKQALGAMSQRIQTIHNDATLSPKIKKEKYLQEQTVLSFLQDVIKEITKVQTEYAKKYPKDPSLGELDKLKNDLYTLYSQKQPVEKWLTQTTTVLNAIMTSKAASRSTISKLLKPDSDLILQINPCKAKISQLVLAFHKATQPTPEWALKEQKESKFKPLSGTKTETKGPAQQGEQPQPTIPQSPKPQGS